MQCEQCGRITPRRNHRFCSRTCYGAWKFDQRPEFICKNCGKSFAQLERRDLIGKTGVNSFCSRWCTLDFRKRNNTQQALVAIQQAWDVLTDAQRGWLAGMIDGEGGFNISKHQNGSLHCQIFISNTYEPVIDYVASLFPYSIKYTCRRPKQPNWKTAYRWIFTCSHAVLLSKLLFPYLKIKHQQAGLFASLDMNDSYKIPPNVSSKLRMLNARGVHT